VITTLISELTP